jgi:Flp pilus assembly pilin Flp
MSLFGRLLTDSNGQDLIEYVLLGAIVAMVALVGVSQFGASVSDWSNAMTLKVKKSHCSVQGMIASGGKCHGG